MARKRGRRSWCVVVVNPSLPDMPEDGDGSGLGATSKDAGGEDDLKHAAAPERTRLVVGISASASGIDALKGFFSTMPADIGMAFVIVQHLDPNYDSSLAAIIAGYTALPVRLAEDGMLVGPDQVYVIPPDAILTIKGGRLHLSSPASPAARRVSVNTFLSSLAEDQGENAVGIILSGFGSDGALGIAAVKEHGGLTLSQAEFDHHAKQGMPQSAASAASWTTCLPSRTCRRRCWTTATTARSATGRMHGPIQQRRPTIALRAGRRQSMMPGPCSHE